jgi:hypothetical protein
VAALAGGGGGGSGGPLAAAGCRLRADALLAFFGFRRSFGASVGALGAYLAVLHLLSFAALVRLARRRA